MNNFVVIDSIYGKFIVNRHCDYQAEALIKTGATHIEPELKNILAVVATLPQGALVLDAGANIGFVSIPVANALRDKAGQIFSFEVQKILYYALCGTVALNDLENVSVFNQGLGAHPGRMFVPEQNYSAPADFGTLSLIGEASKTQGTIEIIRIDDLDLPRLDFLKIDVEGMELDVLEGGSQTIMQGRPWCWVEYHKIDRKELILFFSQMDYSLFAMDTLNVLCAPNEKIRSSGLKIDAPLFL